MEHTPCDSCGHHSFMFVTLTSGHELTYCAHHGNEKREALLTTGARIVDLTHLVTNG